MRSMLCPRCHRHELRRQTHKLTGDAYYVCENYPRCAYVSPMMEETSEPEATEPTWRRAASDA